MNSLFLLPSTCKKMILPKTAGNYCLPFRKKKGGLHHTSINTKAFGTHQGSCKEYFHVNKDFKLRTQISFFQQQHPLHANNPHDLVPFLELKLYADNRVPDLTSFTSPRLFSTHLPPLSLPESIKCSACKLVYLCRNPKDTFVSLWHFTNKLRPKDIGTNSLEDTFDRFCRGVSLYGPFWDHVLGYWKESLENPGKILFLKYEEMKEKPDEHLRRIAQFLGYPFSPEEEKLGLVDEILGLCSFDTLSKLEVNKSGKLLSGEENKTFFRRGEVGDWKNFLSAEMEDRLDQISEQKLHKFGLKF
ncbi:hypothetical protein TEA_010530 [Camellia sinensis var. sinensis]|uniref:Sulfotransferase n=1 Tax=Camellia sinensis var. sinensis TaxID=542762 RepID=A0A4S4EIA0_CAMSN|nr:hypothetical protein TEA_010530 [Camellia sinensis var. sinensis]